jgi:hypothetical protein
LSCYISSGLHNFISSLQWFQTQKSFSPSIHIFSLCRVCVRICTYIIHISYSSLAPEVAWKKEKKETRNANKTTRHTTEIQIQHFVNRMDAAGLISRILFFLPVSILCFSWKIKLSESLTWYIEQIRWRTHENEARNQVNYQRHGCKVRLKQSLALIPFVWRETWSSK